MASDTYLYIHDQTLRLANTGHTPQEIAEELVLPSTLRNRLDNRGYYGTVRHNAKAVYQAYFGWYDGNPANLDPLPPVEAGKKYVEAMGGAIRATTAPPTGTAFRSGWRRMDAAIALWLGRGSKTATWWTANCGN